jgi:hypothetical protein
MSASTRGLTQPLAILSYVWAISRLSPGRIRDVQVESTRAANVYARKVNSRRSVASYTGLNRERTSELLEV